MVLVLISGLLRLRLMVFVEVSRVGVNRGLWACSGKASLAERGDSSVVLGDTCSVESPVDIR